MATKRTTEEFAETVASGTLTDSQRDYVQRVREQDLIEGWWWGASDFRPRPDQPEHPGGPAVPHVWSWSEVGPLIRESSEVIGLGQAPGEAERRVLVLRNPGLGGKYAVTNTLFADLQVIEPGETAPSHRHTTTAARFVFEGEGGWTTVGGEKVTLKPRDVVLNPQWAWHAHGNEGPDDFLFLDVLDIPLITAVGTAVWDFSYEQVTGDRKTKVHDLDRPTNHSPELFRYGGIVPHYVEFTRADHSPLVSYRYELVADALNRLRGDQGSPYDGVIVELRNPVSGLPVAPSMAMYAQLLEPAATTRSHRHNSSTIYIVMDGQGETVVEGETIEWSQFDTFVVPSWRWHEHRNARDDADAVLYSVSDRPVVEKLGLYREQGESGSGDGTGDVEDTGWQPNEYRYR